MTGYTVHTGSTQKFSTSWDHIFGKAARAAKPAKAAKKTKKVAKKAAKKRK